MTIPEFGTITAPEPPIVVLTSNRTRELHDALKRRCLYHWIDHPGLEREVEIVRSRAPEVSAALARQVVTVVQQLRDRDDLLKPPGVAETLDWARALTYLGATELDLASAAATLGALLKYREDADRVKAALDRMLTPMTVAATARPDEILLGFTRALRAAGVPVTQDRSQGFLAAVAAGRCSTTGRRPTGPAGRPCAPRPTTWRGSTRSSTAWFDGRDGLPQHPAPRRLASAVRPPAAGHRGGRCRR